VPEDEDREEPFDARAGEDVRVAMVLMLPQRHAHPQEAVLPVPIAQDSTTTGMIIGRRRRRWEA
jgi:hypothetical protein